MSQLIQKAPFLLELFFNGSFILLSALKHYKKIPTSWDQSMVAVVIDVGMWLVPIVIFLSVVVNYINSLDLEDFLRRYVFSIVVFVPLVITWGDEELTFWLSSAHLLSSILALYDSADNDFDRSNKRKSTSRLLVLGPKLRPAQIVFLSFLSTILLGSFLLMLPPVVVAGSETVKFEDALFLAASATCVTGLSTLNIGDQFTIFGQLIILLLIQVGGLGIMTLSSSITILLGKSMAMRDRMVMQDLLDVSSMDDLLSMILDIIKYTFFIELWGAILLTIGFIIEGFSFGKAVYFGFFHSISAFCNAGFALFSTSFESYSTNPLLNWTIMVLITLGGLGFIVLKELQGVVFFGKRLSRISVNAKIVLVTSAVLTVGGAILIFASEYLNALDVSGYSLMDKVQISLFQSVTLRTAGFNNIPLANLHTYTLYAMMIFMFIGASPGSTGGGIKTTSFAIMIQSVMATLTGRKDVTIFDRKISAQAIVRTIALTIISMGVAVISVFIMMQLEPEKGSLALMFEVISALGTVGLSLGVSPLLSMWGKIAISVVMFIGRIGPLTLVLALAERGSSSGKVEYPDGRIMIG
ncbi:MAG TPA: potassium transporter TrkG [Bacteriovoracaceae bacterium]|nr:potassium transporter TrkG [Bacteriovoracaceae bacterium]